MSAFLPPWETGDLMLYFSLAISGNASSSSLSLGRPLASISEVGRAPCAVNYRTSHRIRTQADRLLGPVVTDVDGNSDDRGDTVSVFNGPPPTIQTLKSEIEEVKTVGNWIAEQAKAGVMPTSSVCSSDINPCLSGCHPQPLAVVFGHAHGRSPAWQSSVPTIAPRVLATFSRRRGLRRLPGEGSLERRVCLPPLSGGGRAVPLRKSSWRLALPQVPP